MLEILCKNFLVKIKHVWKRLYYRCVWLDGTMFSNFYYYRQSLGLEKENYCSAGVIPFDQLQIIIKHVFVSVRPRIFYYLIIRTWWNSRNIMRVLPEFSEWVYGYRTRLKFTETWLSKRVYRTLYDNQKCTLTMMRLLPVIIVIASLSVAHLLTDAQQTHRPSENGRLKISA